MVGAKKRGVRAGNGKIKWVLTLGTPEAVINENPIINDGTIEQTNWERQQGGPRKAERKVWSFIGGRRKAVGLAGQPYCQYHNSRWFFEQE